MREFLVEQAVKGLLAQPGPRFSSVWACVPESREGIDTEGVALEFAQDGAHFTLPVRRVSATD